MLDKNAIMELIPHREPFLLIDEIAELEPGVRVKAFKHLRIDESWYAGHFPGNPVTPGVLMLEMLAQAGAVCVLSMPENKGKTAYFAGLDGVKFKRMVLPGETLTLEVEMTRMRSSVGIGEAVASVNGEKAVVAQMKFAFGDRRSET